MKYWLYLVFKLAAGATLIFPLSGLALAGLLITFWLTTVPFTRKAWSKDHTIALLSPVLLAIRALALGIGYGWGLLFAQAYTAPLAGAKRET